MKILLLVQKEQRVILDRLYDGISKNAVTDIYWLTSKEQDNLKFFFKKNIKLDDYDRVVLFLRFKKELRQVAFIRTILNLTILEHDAYQNYITCKYTGKFSSYYRKLPWARVLSSGAAVTRRLQGEGVDAVFVPKGYDQELLSNQGIDRDIELGFIGSIKSATYSHRKSFLERLDREEKLLVTRTSSGQEYVDTLNRIRFFVSADIGMGEYMIKNFEAMACGCVLFAYDQGQEENEALGFVDMHNIVLYKDIQSFKQKLELLRADLNKAQFIADNGQRLVEQNYTFSRIGKLVVEALLEPLRPQPKLSYLQKIRNKLGI
ncbi:glycosyltransferase family 1 protein [Pseudomonas sp. C27(2019)]|uniref:glycosyltransferase family protein n=1 Tax=Pseudomonas sp. C27(2019) TaxID=2604941 RepID=UPI001247CE08|nr:glycosyltransferase [Pseudomonas sp. C27(2019)]QEY57990.1 glycosyltransferase family 1 protein [Pseudomonas sp. C27(2019)]